ncbi:DUF3426 domain-containing protein [Lysobacter brunescens]|uniref:DUF3426 domain-containing protein n=1 Tax=Lysobacter brunescens TaxID=262323 RepID=A0ABW2YAJ0_9GAMM
MFINCPYCKALVSTDPVTDLPPTHCPHCDSLLRRDPETADDVAEVAPLDLGTLLDPRAIAEAAAEAEAHAAARAAAAIETPRVESPAVEATDVASILESVRIDAARQTQPSDDEETAVADTTGATSPPADTRVPPAAVPIAPATATTRRLPSFARNADGSARPARERWLIVAVIALAVLLVLQLLLADRARLAANAQWRPMLATLCSVLRCELPPWREPAAFTLLQRDVRQHPSLPGVLRVSATFRNDARWPQPWPGLQLTLSDINGRPAGQRRFEAQEYLGGTPGQAELASGESATVAMDILEPAPQIVAYDFRFR